MVLKISECKNNTYSNNNKYYIYIYIYIYIYWYSYALSQPSLQKLSKCFWHTLKKDMHIWQTFLKHGYISGAATACSRFTKIQVKCSMIE